MPADRDINWQDDVPEATVPCFDLLSPRYDQRLRCYILSERQVGVWVHFAGGRTGPCTRGTGGCDGCRAGLRRYWKGFLFGLFDRAAPVAILEYTAAAAEPHTRRLTGQGKPIRGCQVVAFRRDGKPQGKVILQIADQPRPDLAIPELPDLRWALMRIWNAPTKGAAPPRPARAEGEDWEVIPLPGVG